MIEKFFEPEPPKPAPKPRKKRVPTPAPTPRQLYCKDCNVAIEKTYYGHRLCYPCYRARYSKSRKLNNDNSVDRAAERVEKFYKDWKATIAKIKKPYKTLTEAEWLEACNYFGGCAVCHKDEIAARGMFIPFSESGAYCNWNVVPMCERCALEIKLQPNPWRRMYPYFRTDRKSKRKELEKMVAYLQPRLEEAAREHD